MTPADSGLVATVCCDADGGPAYAVEGSIFTTGAAIQWLRDGLGIIRSAAETGPPPVEPQEESCGCRGARTDDGAAGLGLLVLAMLWRCRRAR